MSSYPASNTTQPQSPGLKDDAIAKGTDALDRAEDREEGLGSSPGITDKAAKQVHQGMEQATGESSATTKTEATFDSGSKGLGEQIGETVGGMLQNVTKNLK